MTLVRRISPLQPFIPCEMKSTIFSWLLTCWSRHNLNTGTEIPKQSLVYDTPCTKIGKEGSGKGKGGVGGRICHSPFGMLLAAGGFCCIAVNCWRASSRSCKYARTIKHLLREWSLRAVPLRKVPSCNQLCYSDADCQPLRE